MCSRVTFPIALAVLFLSPPLRGFTQEEFDAHVAKLQANVPAGFTVVVEDPWVVIGNGTPGQVKAFAGGTVRWATEKFKKDYFQKDPAQIIDIWLFVDDASYRKYALELFDDGPNTPYGYYSEEHHALVMNIATGGGTLVHEMVHPFIHTNFPECPAWFNEGLGSLYEQSSELDGHIVGLTNWRLRGLQEAIRKNTVPSFKGLCSTTTNQFYNGDRGTNYAQARYLCYYLQEKGLLLKFYHAFHDDVKTDPAGYDTLMKTLDAKDMEAFQKAWEAWVSALTYP